VRRRPFPQLNTELTELSLGTWGLSGEAYGPISDAEADAVIDRAAELGITLFDTADVYARGEMERRLGRRLKQRSPTTLIATRIGTERTDKGARKRFEVDYLREAFERSRERIGRDRIDVLMLHNPSVVTLEAGDATGLLKELKDNSSVGAWGVSAGSKESALAALEAGAEVLGITYNLFHSRDLHAVAAEIAMRGVTVLAHSVLAYGLLACHWGPERTFDEGDHRRDRWKPAELRKRISQLEVARSMVGGDVLTPRAGALRFVLSNSLISSAILGPRSTAQLEQLMREAGNGPPYLPDKLLSELPSQLIERGVVT
jgi:aryl-alcohol dehydrogenase-like predicted oxidoreductase